MATAKTIKKPTVAAKSPAAVIAAPAVSAPAAAPRILTIIVVDDKSLPVQGARVSINPGSVAGITDASGQYQFPIGNYPKYDVTASYGSDSVTVPYYVTRDGATRFVVNPAYVHTVEQQRSSLSFSGVAKYAGIAIAIAVVLVLGWKFIFAHPRD